jgi:hypothetical protein
MANSMPCSECGRSVDRFPSRFVGNVFCSKECRSSFMAKTARVWVCMGCGVVVGRRVKRCRECENKSRSERPSYVRTPEHKAIMSGVTTKPKPHMRGRKFPKRNEAIAAAWTEEKRQAARERGKKFAADRDWLVRIAQALSGPRNPMWQGGIANSKYAPGFCKTLKQRIRQRDYYICQLCGRTEDGLGYRLSIHHSDYDKSNHSESNLFATCKRCNSLVNARRPFWQSWFRDLARQRQLL